MDIQQLFGLLKDNEGLKNEFNEALAAGKEILERFLKDHDIKAAFEDVVAYIKDNAQDLAGIIPGDILGNLGNLGNIGEAVSGIASNMADGLGEGAGDVAGKVVGAVTDAVSDGDPSDVVDKVAEAVAGKEAGGFLAKLKAFFSGK